MATVQISIGFTVAPGSGGQPLTVTPASVSENLTVGVAADGTAVSTVSGGVPPYSIAVDASSTLPDGITLTLDAKSGNVTLVGTPTTSTTTTEQVLVNVSDSAPATTAQAKAAKK